MTDARNHHGFSLVEAVIASTVLAVIVVSALNATGRLSAARYDEADRGRARALADEMVAQIMPKDYAAVDAYNGDSESPPVDSGGLPIAGFTGWSRTVTVEWVRYASGDITTSASDKGLKRVTVIVKHGNKEMARRVFLRTSAMDATR